MSTRRLMQELRQAASRHHVAAAPAPRPASSAKPARGASELERPRPRPASDPALLEKLKASTPAKIGVGRAGLRYRTQTLLQFQTDFAVAKAAVESQVPEGWAEEHGLLPIQTEAVDAEQFLVRPDLGRRLPEEALRLVRERCERSPDVQIVVADGLSATAVMQHAPSMIASLAESLAVHGRRLGTGVFVRHGRSKVIDLVGEAVGARVGVILIGERPGLGTGDGMSAYLVWDPRPERTDAEKQAISNIHRRGLSPEEAGRHAARVIEAIFAQQTSGVKLDLRGLPAPQGRASEPKPRVNQAHAEPLLGCGQSHGQSCPQCREGKPGRTCGRSEGRPCQASASA